MNLDIRVPIGLLFTTLGALLVVYGLASDKAIYEKSLGLNINLWWGLVMLVFGGLMAFFGRRKTMLSATGPTSPPDDRPRAHY